MKGIFSCFAESAKEFTKLRSLVITALFIAISMIIEAFSIDLQFAKLNFAFLAIAVIGMLFGPCMGLVAGFACDIVCNPATSIYAGKKPPVGCTR